METAKLGIETDRDDAASVAPQSSTHGEWLQTQLRMVPGARAGLVVVESGEQYRPSALWPSAAAVQPLVDLVSHAISDLSGAGEQGVITELPVAAIDSDAPNYAIAFPIKPGDRILAVVALALRVEGEAALTQAAKDLQWGAGGLEALLYRTTQAQDRHSTEGLRLGVACIAVVHEEEKADAASLAYVTELARQYQCDRASIGYVVRGRTKLDQMSHTPEFQRKMNIARLIEEAMDECVDQRQRLALDDGKLIGNEDAVHMACDRLAEATGRGAILALPLFVANTPIGALLLERPAEIPFTEGEVDAIESAAALIAPALKDKRANDRSIFRKILNSLHKAISEVVGPRYTMWKAIAGVLMVSILASTFLRIDYRQSFDAKVQPQLRRVMAAPFEGYIDRAPVRAGDVVTEGQEMIALEDTALQLERLKWLGESARIDGLYQEAVAKSDRSESIILQAQREQAQAQLGLIAGRIERATMTAPFDGVVVSGDLSQRLGGAVDTGEELMVLAPRDQYRIDLLIRESRIADIEVGQTGSLLLPALVGQRPSFQIVRVTPETVARDGRTYFIVEAEFDNALPQLQPGMEGVAKVMTGKAAPLRIWTRDMTEWVRMKIWYWS